MLLKSSENLCENWQEKVKGEVMKKHLVVTLGCEYGAGGPVIGKLLAAGLGLELYDRDFIDSVIERTGVSRDTLDKANSAKQVKGRSLGFEAFLGPRYEDLTERIIYVQKEAIRKLADKSSCVIIGRCADYILKDRQDCLNFFVYAPEHVRARNLEEELSVSIEEAREMLEHQDRLLHARYKYMTGTYRGDRRNRHLLIDSSVLGWEGTARFLEQFVREKFAELQT